MKKLKLIIILESITIVVLAAFLLMPFGTKNTYNKDDLRLLSPRIPAGILKPQSLLILNFEPLEKDLQNYINSNNLNVSLYILNIRNGASLGIDEDRAFEPASLNKLPIAIIILKKVEDGNLSLETKLPILERDRDDKSGTLYENYISEMSVKDLLYYMLAESDNTAFRALGEQVTLKDLQHLSTYLDYYNAEINYLGNNTHNVYQITPKSTGNLFLSVYISTILEPKYSEMILEYLTNTTFNIKKYAGLPNDVIVAQKYGSYFVGNKSNFHSCGIMYIQDSRIFYCVMTSEMERDKASQVIGDIVNKTYSYVIEAKKIKDLKI
ncbi:serine hydrolase [Candidatus Pacearchaeota archaeon]|nr:serine hydrolase [Candidatus Pacearchaeota archaeon]